MGEQINGKSILLRGTNLGVILASSPLLCPSSNLSANIGSTFFFFFLIWSHRMGSGILVPGLGIESRPWQ